MAQAVVSPVSLELVYEYFLFATKCFDEKKPTKPKTQQALANWAFILDLEHLCSLESVEHSNCTILVLAPSPCSKLEQI